MSSIRALRTRRGRHVHGRIAFLHTAPKLTASTAQDIEANTSALTETHQDEVTVRTAFCVVAHLRRAIEGALVCALAPLVAAIPRRILDVLVPACIGRALSIKLLADLGYC